MEPASPGLLAAALQPCLDTGSLAGAVLLVGDRDRVLALETLGHADLAAGTPMRPDTFFWVASMTKPITGAAFMMLVDEGLVGVDDRVEKYIPGFADFQVLHADGTLTRPSHPLLVREILSHTSGLRFLHSRTGHPIDRFSLKDSIESNLREPLLADPGTKYIYSNEGIDTAGRIIELVTGQSYEAFLQERLFTPLGMTETTFFPTPEQVARLAVTYKAKEDKSGLEKSTSEYLSMPLDGPGRHPAPGGGLFSTAEDMYRFCRMLLNGGAVDERTYLAPESLRRMTTKQTGPLVEEQYGFGCSSSADGKTYGHGGALKTHMTVDHGQIRVFLVQHQGDWAGDHPGHLFDDACRRFYPGAGVVTPPAAAVGTGVGR